MAQKQPAHRAELIHTNCRSSNAAAVPFCCPRIFFGTLLDRLSKLCYHKVTLF